MPTVTVLVLGEWEVQVRVVPPTASYRWRRANVIFPPKPPRPTAVYHSNLTGHDEETLALPGSKEYIAWELDTKVWEEECARLMAEAIPDETEFAYDYAILCWRMVGDEEWLKIPPADWEIPAAYGRHGVPIDEANVRLEFIMNELLEDTTYIEAVQAAMYPYYQDEERNPEPVSDEEVAAALQTFPGGDVISGPTGRVGGSDSTSGRGRQGQGANEPIRPRHVGRRRQKRNSLLVQLFSRRARVDEGSG